LPVAIREGVPRVREISVGHLGDMLEVALATPATLAGHPLSAYPFGRMMVHRQVDDLADRLRHAAPTGMGERPNVGSPVVTLRSGPIA
jgi:hypothetical protein